MEWINKYLIPPYDKLKHFYLGALIMFVCLVLTSNMVLSLAILLIAAVLKEIYDYTSKTGKPEILDIVYTIWPGILFFVYWILN